MFAELDIPNRDAVLVLVTRIRVVFSLKDEAAVISKPWSPSPPTLFKWLTCLEGRATIAGLAFLRCNSFDASAEGASRK